MLKEELRIKIVFDIDSFYEMVKGYESFEVTPFQLSSWQKLVFEEFMTQKLSGKYFGAIVSDNNGPIIGGHFFYKKRGRKRGIFFLTTASGETDYNDLSYYRSSIRDDAFEFLFNSIISLFRTDTIWFDRVLEESPLSYYLMSTVNKSTTLISKTKCAEIEILDNFDVYFKSLAKGIRQNIRTAKNRLVSDGRKYEIMYFFDKPIPSSVAQKMIRTYEERRITKNQTKKSLLFKLKELIRKSRNRKYNLFYNSMISLTNSYSAIITIDNKFAGYFYGLRHNNTATIMNVSFSETFSRYSPGMILLNDSLEKIHNERLLTKFDLATGDERYKLNLGAKIHNSLSFKYEKQ